MATGLSWGLSPVLDGIQALLPSDSNFTADPKGVWTWGLMRVGCFGWSGQFSAKSDLQVTLASEATGGHEALLPQQAIKVHQPSPGSGDLMSPLPI